MKFRKPGRSRKKDKESGSGSQGRALRSPLNTVKKALRKIKIKTKGTETSRVSFGVDNLANSANLELRKGQDDAIHDSMKKQNSHLTQNTATQESTATRRDNADQKVVTTTQDPNSKQEPKPNETEKPTIQISTSLPASPPVVHRRRSGTHRRNSRGKKSVAKDGADPNVAKMYEGIPELETSKLPRGGISIDTDAVGRIQFGIPPETIKDSMCMGIEVPLFYIVPVERFCREMGPALGVNLAEFEFPAYFNFFVKKKRCTLIVDSEDAERNIRRVFSETLLGPAQFRKEDGIQYEEEDFAPDFPREAIPDFQKELKHFRVMPDGKELVIETLLNFTHFVGPVGGKGHEHLGMPPAGANENDNVDDDGSPWKQKVSAFSRVKICDLAVLYPPNATQEEIAAKSCKRAEVFRMPGGAEYIVHDINEENIIVGKGRFSGNLRVSASMGIHGFGECDDEERNRGIMRKSVRRSSTDSIPRSVLPPTFHPPSFGVTVLGNSHGFDRNGSVSGYVLWINGRGVMIDPPPYSSATLEREGIRPRTIVGIILTHCHADHDAGAFQKVLTGSPVVVITTPTIYNSFIRKYAALSALSPALLRHSHRHKPAVIGKPLRFQGATFHFTYTLHSIPCVGFRVEWRGRSMIFTGDHFNCPEGINKLEEQGILSAARAQDLINLPLQDTDLLLHEAGVPPLHTPLEVLMALPKRVKDRLYVVHTQKLPEGCELRVAPTGTAGTIRLDEKEPLAAKRRAGMPSPVLEGMSYEDEVMYQSLWMSNEYNTYSEGSPLNDSSFLSSSLTATSLTRSFTKDKTLTNQRFSISSGTYGSREPPRVALRPTSSTDAWFILNLLSAVPFLSGLSYASTMEVLETARVDAYAMNDIVVPAARRREVLCVVWEGTCMEREVKPDGEDNTTSPYGLDEDEDEDAPEMTVWHAGDWTGPISLQPEKALSGESELSRTHDIVAMSSQGVKVITVEYSNLQSILKTGSSLYRTYLSRKSKKNSGFYDCLQDCPNGHLFEDILKNVEIMDVIECNSILRKISAVQKRHLESLAEGPVYYAPGERLWRSGTPVDKAFIVVGGTASFLPKRRNGGSVGVKMQYEEKSEKEDDDPDQKNRKDSLCELMRKDAEKVRMIEDAKQTESENCSIASGSSLSSYNIEEDEGFEIGHNIDEHSYSLVDNHDYAKLRVGLQQRADTMGLGGLPSAINAKTYTIEDKRYSDSDRSEFSDSVSAIDEVYFEFDDKSKNFGAGRRRSSIDRYANKQLVRLYNRRAYTAGLVFSLGHFLGDISKMVAGLLSTNYDNATYYDDDDNSAVYGFGEKNEGNNGSRKFVEMTIHEQEGDRPIMHNSTLAAGKDGCIVLVFSKSSLEPFFDEHPGLLLSLLGQSVVL